MGTWGFGVFQNDHAQDLLFGEALRWVEQLRYWLDLEQDKEGYSLTWDDVEGALIYVHLLAAVGSELPGLEALTRKSAEDTGKRPYEDLSSREIAEGWKATYLRAFGTLEAEKHDAEYYKSRLALIVSLFDTLISNASADDAVPKAKPGKQKSNPKRAPPKSKDAR